MSRLFPDTHPKIEAIQIELLRNLPPWRKLEMGWQLNAAVRTMVFTGLHARYPNDLPQTTFRRLADLLLVQELADQVCGQIEETEDVS
jgi:hypothetical protein